MQNNTPLVSVVIPVYKAEKYLNGCVDSVIDQTYKNIEIILVDDGSPDNCGKICDEYAKKDNRIVVVHKENGGLPSARNAGMDKAKGEYICFVDSDDTVEDEYVRLLLESLLENGTDMSVCGRNSIYSENSTVKNVPKKRVINRENISENEISYLFDISFMIQMCEKMFKCSLTTELRVKDIDYAEDAVFVYTYLSKCNSISFVPHALYNYQKMNSQLTKKYHKGMLESMKANFEATHLGIYSFVGEWAEDVLKNKFEILAFDHFYAVTTHYYDSLYTKSHTLDDFGKEKYNGTYEYYSKYFNYIENLKDADSGIQEKNRFYCDVLKNWNCDTYFKLQKKYRKKERFKRRMIKLKRKVKKIFKK